MSPKLAIGTVFEVPTAGGLGHAQYAYEHPTYGSLVRLLPGLSAEPLADPCALVAEREIYWAYVPVDILSRVGGRAVAQCALPPVPHIPPLMKSEVDRKAGKPTLWRVNDSEDDRDFRVVRTEGLTRAEREMPMLQLWNPELLVRRLAMQWTAADDFDPAAALAREAADGAVASAAPVDDDGEAPAEQALLIRFSPHTAFDELSQLEGSLTERAEQVAGEYDGHEIADSGELTLYVYGPDADALASAVEPVFEWLRAKGDVSAVKRYGPPGTAEVSV